MARFKPGKAAWPAALGAAAVLMLSAPASAAPIDPAPVPLIPDASAPVQAASAEQAASADQAPPTDEGVPHLSSPENLPPGTTETPAQEGPRMSYWRELWHAYQTQEVSGSDALLLLTQRPMDPESAPPAGMPAGPQAPLPPATPVPEPLPPATPLPEPPPPTAPLPAPSP